MCHRLALSELLVYERVRRLKNKKKLVEGVQKLIRTKQIPSAPDSGVHRKFGDALDPYMSDGVENNAVKEWIKPVDEK